MNALWPTTKGWVARPERKGWVARPERSEGRAVKYPLFWFPGATGGLSASEVESTGGQAASGTRKTDIQDTPTPFAALRACHPAASK